MNKKISEVTLGKHDIFLMNNVSKSTYSQLANQLNSSVKIVQKRLSLIGYNKRCLPNTTLKLLKDVKNNNRNYIMGLLSTDGLIVYNTKRSDYRISITSKDEEQVQNVKKFFQKGSIYKFKKYFIYTTGERILIEYLISIGITPNKSKTINYLNKITWDYVRGVIDGDGYVCTLGKRKYVTIYTISNIFKDQLITFFRNKNMTPTVQTIIKENRQPLYRINIFKKRDFLKLREKIYSNYQTKLFLTRKKLKFYA